MWRPASIERNEGVPLLFSRKRMGFDSLGYPPSCDPACCLPPLFLQRGSWGKKAMAPPSRRSSKHATSILPVTPGGGLPFAGESLGLLALWVTPTMTWQEPQEPPFGRKSGRGRDVWLIAPEDFIIVKLLSCRASDPDNAVNTMRSLSDALDGPSLEREIASLQCTLAGHSAAERWAKAGHHPGR